MIYASAAVKAVAQEALGLESVLECFCAPAWHEPWTKEHAPLSTSSGDSTGLLYRAIELPGQPPPFASASPHGQTGHSVAYEFVDAKTGKKLVVAPDVGTFSPALLHSLETADAVLCDGTFWSANELAQVRPGAKRAADMGHVTIDGGSLEVLRRLRANPKIYIHINNTNPILDPNSPERAMVERAGIVVGQDGFEFAL